MTPALVPGPHFHLQAPAGVGPPGPRGARGMPQGERPLTSCFVGVWASANISTPQTHVNLVSFGQFMVRP